MNDIEVAVKEAIMMKMSQLEDAIRNGVQLEDIRLMLELAEGKLAEIKKLEKRLSSLEDMRLDGEIDKERYMLRKAEIETQVRDLEGEYQVLMTQADNSKNARNEDMLETVKRVLNVIDKEADPKDMNRAYKSIIHSIIWERESIDEQGSVTVNFL
jgi:hypothetical protein